jgi:hypothetical protein
MHGALGCAAAPAIPDGGAWASLNVQKQGNADGDAMLWAILFFGALCLGFLIVLGSIALSWLYRLRDFGEIVAQGGPTEAMVERKYGHHRVVITYRDASGRMHRHDRKLLPGDFHRLQEGRPVSILYLPHRPHVWAFAEDVAQARQLQAQRLQGR